MFWVAPRLFSDVIGTMRIATEVIFGPVQTVAVFDAEDDAVEIANESEYGLVSAVSSGDQAVPATHAR
jgi:acyl-CoA reductase-like NAD-dependent aldehyde dehydrogenase